jgi:H+-transporting ATPase
LLFAVLGTQTLATLMAVYGLGIMTPLGWGWALLVWGYALVWALATDRVKLLAYRLLDPAAPKKQADGTPRIAETPPDLRPRIAKGAFALYEQHGSQDGHAVQDWLDAEQKVEKA